MRLLTEASRAVDRALDVLEQFGEAPDRTDCIEWHSHDGARTAELRGRHVRAYIIRDGLDRISVRYDPGSRYPIPHSPTDPRAD